MRIIGPPKPAFSVEPTVLLGVQNGERHDGAGYLDRHLRKARAAYRRRREVACAALARHRPEWVVGGVSAGLFLCVTLPPGSDEARTLAAARGRGIAVDGVNEHALHPQPPGLAVGFAASPEPTLRRALASLARAGA